MPAATLPIGSPPLAQVCATKTVRRARTHRIHRPRCSDHRWTGAHVLTGIAEEAGEKLGAMARAETIVPEPVIWAPSNQRCVAPHAARRANAVLALTRQTVSCVRRARYQVCKNC